MEQKDLPKILQAKISEYEKRFDAMIQTGQKFVEAENERRKNLKLNKNYVKTYADFPKIGEPGWKEYSEYGIKNLQDLIDNKTEIATANAYAYVKSGYYADDLKGVESLQHRVFSENLGGPVSGFAVLSIICLLFWNWWSALVCFAIGVVYAAIASKVNKPKIDEAHAVVKEWKDALRYVNETLESLSDEQKDRIQKIGVHLQINYTKSQALRREIARLEQEIDTLGREVAMPATTQAAKERAIERAVAEGRKEIVDDAGRTQGYTQDGKIYNDKSDVVGYVDEHDRVYDADYKRVGEVNKDGKIEKYR